MLETVDFSAEKMSKEEYKQVHDELIDRLVLLQQQARSAGVGLVVLFEGWDGAGKGSRISDLMYNLDARATSVHVTADFDKKAAKKFAGRKHGVTGFEPVMQEFWQALGERSTITFFDNGWYSKGIEQALFIQYGDKIDGSEREDLSRRIAELDEDQGALRLRREMHSNVVGSYRHYAFNFERMLVNDGYVVIKLFLHARKRVLQKRMEHLREDPATAWRASKTKIDALKNYDRAYQLYDLLLEGTNFDFAPWTVINGEDQRSANVIIARTLVEAIEKALQKQPDAAAQAAAAKALQNSAAQMTSTQAAGEQRQEETQDALALAQAQAKEQSSHAPKSSEFIIMSGYPQIDHSKPMPTLSGNYKEQLKFEQNRLFTLENEMYQKRVPLMIMYEGWDAAGKGGNIKRIAQALDARSYTIFPSPAPTKPELAHPHLWRYWTRLPRAGHVGIYDRSWYGRVLVERIEGFASDDEWARAYDEINEFEYEMVQWGALLLKFWVDVTPDEQKRRFEDRAATPSKQWKITEEDWRNRDKYPQYLAAVNDMLRLTSTSFAPCIVLQSDDKQYARIEALKTINNALERRLQE